MSTELSKERQLLAASVDAEKLMSEAHHVAQNLREWAREEFQPKIHPVTLTLNKAATVLDKIAQHFLAERLAEKNFGRLVTAIGEYRAALDEIAELAESGNASSNRDFSDLARKALEGGAIIQSANPATLTKS